MKGVRRYIGVGYTAVCLAAAPAAAATLRCPPDSVKVGNSCIDTYEASVWQIAPTNKTLIKKVQEGKATLVDLTSGGATEVSPASTPLQPCGHDVPANFPPDGNWTAVPGSSPASPGVYAVSIPGVPPTGCLTWFQANQACLLSGKRLLTNREWQGAAATTPDPGTDDQATDCAVLSPGPVLTGSRSRCRSAWGVFDMVGNVSEWVADWADRAPALYRLDEPDRDRGRGLQLLRRGRRRGGAADPGRVVSRRLLRHQHVLGGLRGELRRHSGGLRRQHRVPLCSLSTRRAAAMPFAARRRPDPRVGSGEMQDR